MRSVRLIALIVLFAIPTSAADLSGKWSGAFKVEGGDHEVPQVFVLKQQGKALTGSGGPNAGEQYPIENGSIDGNEVRFELTTGEWKFTYSLKLTAADKLNGDLKLQSTDENRAAKVSLARMAEH